MAVELDSYVLLDEFVIRVGRVVCDSAAQLHDWGWGLLSLEEGLGDRHFGVVSLLFLSFLFSLLCVQKKAM